MTSPHERSLQDSWQTYLRGDTDPLGWKEEPHRPSPRPGLHTPRRNGDPDGVFQRLDCDRCPWQMRVHVRDVDHFLAEHADRNWRARL